MNKHCHSCSMPISGPFAGEARGDYCQHCVDETGKLRPREAVRQGIAMWLSSWSPGVTEEQCLDRAKHFMNAMPAWAE